jgi:hypothetical protein
VFARRRQPPPGSGLHQCSRCHADFVVPVWWQELDDGRLRLLLRCGQCGTRHDIVVAGDVADRFERDYLRVIGEMAADASAFSDALAGDRIGADDFKS